MVVSCGWGLEVVGYVALLSRDEVGGDHPVMLPAVPACEAWKRRLVTVFAAGACPGEQAVAGHAHHLLVGQGGSSFGGNPGGHVGRVRHGSKDRVKRTGMYGVMMP